jgi:hypothetical protein
VVSSYPASPSFSFSYCTAPPSPYVVDLLPPSDMNGDGEDYLTRLRFTRCWRNTMYPIGLSVTILRQRSILSWTALGYRPQTTL